MLCLNFIIGEASSGEESDSEQEAPKGYTDENSSWLKLATGKGKQKLMVRSYSIMNLILVCVNTFGFLSLMISELQHEKTGILGLCPYLAQTCLGMSRVWFPIFKFMV